MEEKDRILTAKMVGFLPVYLGGLVWWSYKHLGPISSYL